MRLLVGTLQDLGAQLAGESAPVALSLLLELAVELTEFRFIRPVASGHSLTRFARLRRFVSRWSLRVARRLVLAGRFVLSRLSVDFLFAARRAP